MRSRTIICTLLVYSSLDIQILPQELRQEYVSIYWLVLRFRMVLLRF